MKVSKKSKWYGFEADFIHTGRVVVVENNKTFQHVTIQSTDEKKGTCLVKDKDGKQFHIGVEEISHIKLV